MNIDLSGSNVLVTGASRGIGRAVSIALGTSGARVAVHYREREAEAQDVAEGAGNGSEAFSADLSDTGACESLFKSVVQTFGRLDVLINNAGVAIESPLNSPMEQWIPIWDATMHVNLRAAGVLSRLAIEHFRTNGSGGGRLIHIASRAAFRGDTEDYLAYAASKGGMVALSKSIARAFGKDGICSFVIAPGFVRTEMAQDFIHKYGDAHATDDLALDRMTEPEDLAPMIVLLASGLADHATGTSIDINAGSYVR